MTKQLFIVILLSLAVFQAYTQAELSDEFKDFKAKHGKTYAEHEGRYRMQIYLKNKHKIAEHNADTTKTWQMGATRFTDLSHEEFIYTHLTLLAPDAKVYKQI
jgi:hypothetical protein